MEYDAVLRPKKVTAPNGHQTISEYGTPATNGQLAANQRFVKVRTQIDATNWKEGYTWFDGLARTFKSQSVEASGDVFVETEYDSFGRLWKTSNPYRANETVYKTENFYDTAGRIYKVKTADGAEVETFYSLATTGANIGTVVTVEDQANKPRRSLTNALGQLVRVDEPNDSSQLGAIDAPNQPTYYVYDTLNNLTTVKQGGTFAQPEQVRSFVYDSLSRLKSATNPESSLIQYTYDGVGNLKTKRDARNIKTIYDYDALNRVIQRCYKVLAGTSSPLGLTTCANNTETAEPNTPDVTYYYDGTYYDAQNTPQTAAGAAKGKLTSVKSSISRTNYTAFDVMGRVTESQQITDDTVPNPMTYTYNLSGALVEQKYPSGRVVRNVVDSDGNLATIQSKKNQNAGYWNYAQHFTYTVSGAVSSMQLGNGRWESTQFNNRLQPTQIALGSAKDATDKLKLNFSYTTTGNNNNNGNILSQTVTVPTETRGGTTYNEFTATQTYTYDSLNRIKQAVETIPGQAVWKQTFKYDRYGNRNFDYGTNPLAPETTTPSSQGTLPKVVNPEILTSNNRFKEDQDGDSVPDYLYDAAGNMTRDALGRTFIYDGENKQTEVKDAGSVSLGTYFYDGDGKRVKRIAGNEVTIFVYDASNKLVAEYSNQITSNPQVSYLTTDHLGSPRINTDKNGNVTARHDYQPFGEEIQRAGYVSDDVRKQFTGYERDAETGLDFAQARFYNPAHGRFITTDPLLGSGSVGNAQSWNRYIYVKNNPLYFIDPTGLYECVANTEQCKAISAELTRLRGLADSIDKKSKNYKKLDRILKTYGCDAAEKECGDKGKNGLTVAVGNTGAVQDAWSGTSGEQVTKTDANPTGRKALVVFSNDLFNGTSTADFTTIVAHEGSHLADGEDWVRSGFLASKNPTLYKTEFDAYTVSGIVEQLKGFPKGAGYARRDSQGKPVGKTYYAWNNAWKNVDASRAVGVQNIVRVTSGQTPKQQGGKTFDKNLTEFDTY
jgi:RHS repeat-associated protein